MLQALLAALSVETTSDIIVFRILVTDGRQISAYAINPSEVAFGFELQCRALQFPQDKPPSVPLPAPPPALTSAHVEHKALTSVTASQIGVLWPIPTLVRDPLAYPNTCQEEVLLTPSARFTVMSTLYSSHGLTLVDLQQEVSFASSVAAVQDCQWKHLCRIRTTFARVKRPYLPYDPH